MIIETYKTSQIWYTKNQEMEKNITIIKTNKGIAILNLAFKDGIITGIK